MGSRAADSSCIAGADDSRWNLVAEVRRQIGRTAFGEHAIEHALNDGRDELVAIRLQRLGREQGLVKAAHA